jgi:hypothetical protein
MQSTAKRWFTEEVRHAGWISAGICVVLACACLSLGAAAHASRAILLVYPLLPVSLGSVAVGALNFHYWHSFRESMEACLAAVLSTYKLLGVLVGTGLCFLMVLGPVFLYFLLLLFFWFLYVALTIVVSFVIATLLAWAAGATLYGLLQVMRYLGQGAQKEPTGKEARPRALRMVV